MSLIQQHLDKNNLHHAYLLEGEREQIVSEILKFSESLGVKTLGNPDFVQIHVDSFKIEDARNLKTLGSEKGFSSSTSQASKKIFIISANTFLLEAQQSLLKLFEEPIENTHFFLIVPDANALLRTFVSRFYYISARQPARNASRSDSGGDLTIDIENAKQFIKMPLKNRLDFIRDLLVEPDDEDQEGNEITSLNARDSTRSKALKFLNSLESALHKNFMSKAVFDIGNTSFFEHFFKVREFLRMPGSSTKSLMESVALIIPNF